MIFIDFERQRNAALKAAESALPQIVIRLLEFFVRSSFPFDGQEMIDVFDLQAVRIDSGERGFQDIAVIHLHDVYRKTQRCGMVSSTCIGKESFEQIVE